MNREELYALWKHEEEIAHIRGWDFSHIEGRYDQDELPWEYGAVVRSYLRDDMRLLDLDTGGGEFLLSLGHPYANTAATEGYPPNVELCARTLPPLGIDFRPCSDASNIPFEDGSFDMIIDRHGDFDPKEIYRLLKPSGLFVTQQVGDNNDAGLPELLLSEPPCPFSGLDLATQRAAFEKAGFQILRGNEAFRPIRFYEVGALVWFARIIEWEFPGFSVDNCLDRLYRAQELIEQNGFIEGTIHRYLIAAKKL